MLLFSYFFLFRLLHIPTTEAAPVPYIPPIDDKVAWYNSTAPSFWVKGPAYRGTVSIIYSSTITLLLCVYTALHLDIPGPKEGTGGYLTRKLKWILISLLFPELVVYTAFLRWQDANVLSKMLISIWREQTKAGSVTIHTTAFGQESYKDNSEGMGPDLVFFKRIGNWFKEIWNKFQAFLWRLVPQFCSHRKRKASAQKPTVKSAPDRIERHGFTLKYCHFVLMGGFSVDTDRMSNYTSSATLEPAGLLLLAERGHFFHISDNELYDKSKADFVAKFLVVIQAMQFLAQVIGRVWTGLPVTILELHTVAHVVYALITYFFWKDKPLDIKTQTRIDTTSDKTLQEDVAYMLVAGLAFTPWDDEVARRSFRREVVYRPELHFLEYFEPHHGLERRFSHDDDGQGAITNNYAKVRFEDSNGAATDGFSENATEVKPESSVWELDASIPSIIDVGNERPYTVKTEGEVVYTLEPRHYLAESGIGPNPNSRNIIQVSDRTKERWTKLSEYVARRKKDPPTAPEESKTSLTTIRRLIGQKNIQQYLSVQAHDFGISGTWRMAYNDGKYNSYRKIRNLEPRKKRRAYRRAFNRIYSTRISHLFALISILIFSFYHFTAAFNITTGLVTTNFSTEWERIVWYFSSGSVAFSSWLMFLYSIIQRSGPGGRFKFVAHDLRGRFPVNLRFKTVFRYIFNNERRIMFRIIKCYVVVLWLTPVFLGRIFFVFEGYYSLRDSRSGVFVTIPWAQMIPHFG